MNLEKPTATRAEADALLDARGTKLQPSDFDRIVIVNHQDGSHFAFTHATYEVVRPWLLVWTEHTGYFRFHLEDIWFRMSGP